MENIDYDALKKRGFLRQRQEGFFILRTRMSYGVYRSEDLNKVTEIAKKYAKGFVHLTTRQGLEVPFIKYGDIDQVEGELKAAGIKMGTSGPRLRTTTCCPGNNWCKSGLVNTFELCDKIENDLGIACGMDLPHKFKIVLSGCPNACTRAQQSEIGIHGCANPSSEDKLPGYIVYLGGCGGKTPRIGFKLERIFNQKEALSVIAKVVKFYKEHAQTRQRLALLIEEFGREKFITSLDIG